MNERQLKAQDDWRIGVIEKYLDEKAPGDIVCIKELKCEALFPDSDFQRDLTPKETQEIYRIMTAEQGWTKIGRKYTSKYGQQRCWRKDLIETASYNELPF